MIIYMESIVCINEEMLVLYYINEENSTPLFPLKSIYSAHGDSDINLDRSKVGVDITTIDSTND